MGNNRSSGSFIDSVLDAFKPGNVILKFIQFFIFGLITATPYLIQNLDQVAIKAASSGASGFWLVIMYIKALFGSTLKGLFIGLATIFDTLWNIKDVLDQNMIGTIIFSIIFLIFGTLTVYQPTRITFNALDSQRGRKHSMAFVMLTSFVLVIIIISPLAWLLNGGETITSGLKDINQTEEVELLENATNMTPEEKIINSINMLPGGGNET